jgi:hypothetical protein
MNEDALCCQLSSQVLCTLIQLVGASNSITHMSGSKHYHTHSVQCDLAACTVFNNLRVLLAG